METPMFICYSHILPRGESNCVLTYMMRSDPSSLTYIVKDQYMFWEVVQCYLFVTIPLLNSTVIVYTILVYANRLIEILSGTHLFLV